MKNNFNLKKVEAFVETVLRYGPCTLFELMHSLCDVLYQPRLSSTAHVLEVFRELSAWEKHRSVYDLKKQILDAHSFLLHDYNAEARRSDDSQRPV